MPNRNVKRPGAAQDMRLRSSQKRTAPTVTEDNIDYDYERSVRFANRGCFTAFAVVFIAFAIVFAGIFMYVKKDIDGGNATAEGSVTVNIPPGSGRAVIGEILKESGLIKNDTIFRFYVRLNGVSGFQSGVFKLDAGMGYAEMIDVITQPPPPRETMWVTFREGDTVWQFARTCEEAGLCTVQEFMDAANNIEQYTDIEFVNYLEFDPNTYMKAEGYLAPNTYEFYVDETPENIVRKLLEETNAVLNEFKLETRDGDIGVYDRLQTLGISLTDLMTMASIVEEEASTSTNDMATVAGVFYNRLNGDRPTNELPRATLGTDVTTRYLGDFVARSYVASYPDSYPEGYSDFTVAQIAEWSKTVIPNDLYYAYMTADDDENSREGLPAGPVSNPGVAAIGAALWPEQHNYVYFVSDISPKFYYATNYRTHLANVDVAWSRTREIEAQGGNS